ncbi:MAG: DUF456 domain-containing protein [Acidobacteriota bacterium]
MALWVLAATLVLLGFVGVVLPAIPGVPLVFAGLLMAAWADGFERVGWLPLTILGILTVASVLVDLAASALGARRAGASRWALLGAAVGTLVGLFFGLPGLLLGPFLGAFAGEVAARRDVRQAGRAGVATWLGILVGTAAKLAFAVTMVAVFVAAYLL